MGGSFAHLDCTSALVRALQRATSKEAEDFAVLESAAAAFEQK